MSHLKKINFTSSLKATIITYNFNLFLPAKSGDFFRHKCLNLKISFKKFFEINIVEKIISLFVLSLYVIFSFFYIQFPQNVIFDFNSIYFYLIFFLLLLIGLGSFVYFYNRIDFNLHKILKLLLYDFFIWFLQFVQILIIMNILDINIKIYEVFFIFGVAIIAGLIPISIGGFGVRDYVIFYLFSYMDIKVDIFIMLLLFNIRYLFPVFIGFFISIYNLKNAK